MHGLTCVECGKVLDAKDMHFLRYLSGAAAGCRDCIDKSLDLWRAREEGKEKMSDGAKVFGLKADEAVAMYLACITVLGMMSDEKMEHEGKDTLEDATINWHTFCTSRGIDLPTPAKALSKLKAKNEGNLE